MKLTIPKIRRHRGSTSLAWLMFPTSLAPAASRMWPRRRRNLTQILYPGLVYLADVFITCDCDLSTACQYCGSSLRPTLFIYSCIYIIPHQVNPCRVKIFINLETKSLGNSYEYKNTIRLLITVF